MVLLPGFKSTKYAEKVAQYVGERLCGINITPFNDGEIGVEILDNLRGEKVFVIQQMYPDPNESWISTLLIGDACRRASCKELVLIAPYMIYSRQDRKVKPRVPISARVMADTLEVAGYDRVVTIDLHAGQIQGFYKIPVDNLYSTPLLVDWIRNTYKSLDNITIVAPDAGGVERARAVAKKLDLNLAVADKRRDRPNQVAHVNIIGDVTPICIIVDDIIDTGGTIVRIAEALERRNVTQVVAYATHGVFSANPNALMYIDRLVITDTIPWHWPDITDRVTILSTAKLIADAIQIIAYGGSLSALFN